MIKGFLFSLLKLIFFSALVVSPASLWGRNTGTGLQIKCPKQVAIGEPFEVRVSSTPNHPRQLTITWLNQTHALEFPGNRHSWTFILGTDVLTERPGPKTLSIGWPGNSSPSTRIILIKAKSFKHQYLTLPSRMVNLSPKNLARYRREKKITDRILHTFTPRAWWHLPFCRPVKKGAISSPYGLKRYINGEPRSPHRGVDFRTGYGAKIHACGQGRVILTANHFFSGNCIYIDHGQGVISMYFHLSRILVKKGAMVKKGQVIALSGKSGRATGPHLHFGISIWGELINPLPLLQLTGK